MKYPKIYLSVILILCLIPALKAQKKVVSYIAYKDSLVVGAILLKNTPINNSQYVIEKVNKKEIRHLPQTTDEYRFKDGTQYFSRTITVENSELKVFLELISSGSVSLFRYVDENGDLFFIQKSDSILVPVDRQKEVLKQALSGCDQINESIQLAAYNKASLKELISLYNSCSGKPIPYKRWGVLLGSSTLSPEITSQNLIQTLNGLSLNNSTAVTAGVFADLPIRMTHFSFHPGIVFSRNRFSANQQMGNTVSEVVMNISSASAPFLLRYTLPSHQWRPFINLGATAVWNFQNSSDVFQFTQNNDVILISRPSDQELVTDTEIGFSAGIGIQYPWNYRQRIAFELRNTRYLEGSRNVSFNQLDFLLSFSF